MSETTKVAVIYYSSTGTVYELAKSVAEGAEKAGAEVRLRKVTELAPKEAIAQNPVWTQHIEDTKDIEIATPDDVLWADAVVFGSPTRFGNVSSQLKQFLDMLGPLWFQGKLADKVYSGFTAGSTRHGGHETTMAALYNTIYHLGGIVVAPGYTDASKMADGNPYGTTHISGMGNEPVDEVARNAAAYQGRRVVRFASAIKAAPAEAGSNAGSDGNAHAAH
jgi:NAD(P)H:quinone oxidoreductase type IV